MHALGIISFSAPSSYTTKIAEHAGKCGVSIYHFSPKQISADNTKINGLYYHPAKKEWEEALFPIPPFIYDRCYYQSKKTQTFQGKMEEMKKRNDLQFLGCGLPNKWSVYQAVCKNKAIKTFLPLTKKLTSPTFLLAHFKPKQKWLLKPISGSQGKGLIKMEEANGSYCVKVVKQPGEQFFTFHNDQQLKNWIHNQMQHTDYIFQPFLPLQTKNGFPFDIRILLQKDENGMWTERFRVMRTGVRHHITSNLAGGGKMLPYSKLLQMLTKYQQKKLQDNLTAIIQTLPLELEANFQPLFEIGIDIGLDANQNLWILDINSKPGHKIVAMAPSSVQDEIYKAPSRYCCYLASLEGNKLGVD